MPVAETFGTIISAAGSGYDGDWWIDSEAHGYQVVRYESEMELMEDCDSNSENRELYQP